MCCSVSMLFSYFCRYQSYNQCMLYSCMSICKYKKHKVWCIHYHRALTYYCLDVLVRHTYNTSCFIIVMCVITIWLVNSHPLTCMHRYIIHRFKSMSGFASTSITELSLPFISVMVSSLNDFTHKYSLL